MLLANVCAGFICYCFEDCWAWRFLGILGAPWGLVHVGGAGSAGSTSNLTGLGLTNVCLSLDTPFGRSSFTGVHNIAP